MPLLVTFHIRHLYTIFQVSYKNIVFYRIENVEFCAKFSLFAQSPYPLFYLKKNRCWKSSYSRESLWWTCFIRNNVQRLVSTFQKWWFRPQQHRPWKTIDKIWRCRIAGIAGRGFNSNPKTIGKSIGSWPGNYFQTLTCHWKDPERRKIAHNQCAIFMERRLCCEFGGIRR